jgi:uncharacterized protein (DUF1697 family)
MPGVSARVLMLRGINLGPTRRVPMADLRAALTDAGYEAVETYVQSGNVVLLSSEAPATLERRAAELLSERFAFAVPVVARTRQELESVLARDPLGRVAREHKRYQVSFLSAELQPAVVATLEAARVEPEQLVVDGREIYAWHPNGVARSKLWNALAGKGLGVTATARNWITVTTLLEMARAAEQRG